MAVGARGFASGSAGSGEVLLGSVCIPAGQRRASFTAELPGQR
jgi:hypothetical protein